MNLIEQYIIEVISVKDITDDWVGYMKKNGHPNFEPAEPMLEVVCKETCYGSESVKDHMWGKSEYEKYKEQGFYMG